MYVTEFPYERWNICTISSATLLFRLSLRFASEKKVLVNFDKNWSGRKSENPPSRHVFLWGALNQAQMAERRLRNSVVPKNQTLDGPSHSVNINYHLPDRALWSCGLMHHVLDRKVEDLKLAAAKFFKVEREESLTFMPHICLSKEERGEKFS